MPGVALILHHGNVARIPYTTAGQGHPEPSPYDAFIFDNKVRFVGDRVACVAADTPEAAARAVALIRVEYELLEPVFDSRLADAPGAPVNPRRAGGDGASGVRQGAQHRGRDDDVCHGDVEAALARADLVVDRDYSVPYQAHCTLEPHSAVTWLDEDNRLVVRVATQVPFHSRRILSRILEIPLQRIRVIKPRIGGGFGGKQEIFSKTFPRS